MKSEGFARFRRFWVVGVLALMAVNIAPAQTAAAGAGGMIPETKAANRAMVAAQYGKLPLSFEANEGQADPLVKFVSRGSGYSVMLTDRAAVLALTRAAEKPVAGGAGAAAKTSVIRMEFADGKAKPAVAGAERLAGTANYFLGSDRAKWHSGVATYGKVRYTGVYPGVDLLYYGNQRQLEYDFVVAPHAESSKIRLRFSGATQLKLSRAGDLRILGEGGEIAFHKPVIYQEKDGVREAVAGRFALLAKGTVGFSVGKYDHERALVIDPVLVYSTFLGNSAVAEAIATDAAGNAYLAGVASRIDYPTTPGAYQSSRTQAGRSDAYTGFVTKLNPSGTALIYSTFLGGTTEDNQPGTEIGGFAVDAAGNAYIAGSTGNPNFPVTGGAYQTINRALAYGGSNAFITKLNAAGSGLIFSTLLGGSGNFGGGESVSGFAIDGSGSSYIAGVAGSTDFPVTNGALQTTGSGPSSYVTKLNAAGSGLIYSTYMRGAYLRSLAVDKDGYAYVTGTTSDDDVPDDFQVTPGAFQTKLTAATAAVVAKLNQTGTGLVYSTFLSGSGTTSDIGGEPFRVGDGGGAIAVDDQGYAYVFGVTSSSDFPVTENAFQKTNTSELDFSDTAFVTKLNRDGNALIYSTYLGGSYGGNLAYTTAAAIQVDQVGNATVAGATGFLDFPVTRGALQTANLNMANNIETSFVTRLNATGSALLYSTYLGGFGGDFATELALGQHGEAYVSGATGSNNFPVTSGAYQTVNTDFTTFVTKLQIGETATALAVPTTIGLTYQGGLTDSEGLPTDEAYEDTPLTFVARVPALGKTGAQTGQVHFYLVDPDGIRTSLGTRQLSGGMASLTTSFTKQGDNTVYAVYSGDAVYAGSLTSQYIRVFGLPARISIVSGTHQSAVIGNFFAESLTVKVVDRHNAPIAFKTVTFTDTSKSGACSFTNPTQATGPDGTASTFVIAGAHATPAGYTPQATIGGLRTNFFLVNTKAQATVSLHLLDRVYTGYPLGAFATTDPAGLHVDFNYDGQGGKAPIAVGTHTVVATINDRDYEGSVTGQTVIEPRPH